MTARFLTAGFTPSFALLHGGEAVGSVVIDVGEPEAAELPQASALADTALAVLRAAAFDYGVGLALRARARIARDRRDFAESETDPRAALATFAAIRARNEEASAGFRALGVSRHVEHVERLADKLGIAREGDRP